MECVVEKTNEDAVENIESDDIKEEASVIEIEDDEN